MDSGTLSIGANLFVYAIVALMAHRVILLDKAVLLTIRFGDKFSVWRFLWRYICFFIIAAVFWGVSIYWLMQSFEPVSDDPVVGSFFIAPIFLIALLPAWIVFAVLMSVAGTILPAAAVNGDASISAALARGGILRTFLRLVFGNLLGAIICTVIVIGASILIPDTPDGFFIDIFGTLLGFVPLILTASALSLAYMEAEGSAPDAGESA